MKRWTARLIPVALTAAAAAAGGPAGAQEPVAAGPHHRHSPALPSYSYPSAPADCPPPVAATPHVAPLTPGAPTTPAAPAPAPLDLSPLTTSAPTMGDASPDFGGLSAGAGLGALAAVAPGYIDNALPLDLVRVRSDFGYRMNEPDRAEFFYPKCGCVRFVPPTNPLFDPNAKGPPQPETLVDSYQELDLYLEKRIGERFSVFFDLPIRWINPRVNGNASGISDISFGFKYAILYSECQVLTFQLRTITPTGDGVLGLGGENWRVVPGLLYLRQVSDKLSVFGEVQDFANVSRASDFTGNVLRYGVGFSYLLAETRSVRVLPTIETVGWTALSGKKFADGGTAVESANGDTVVNLKAGVRVGFGDTQGPGFFSRSDFYVGYGRALTGEFWYEDLLRLEYRLRY